MLYTYASIYLQDKSKYPVDGWVYGFYALFYDVILIILFFLATKDKLLIALFILGIIVQHLIAVNAPSQVPSFGTYSNIVLVVLSCLSIVFSKNI
jgi:hypothetical protein